MDILIDCPSCSDLSELHTGEITLLLRPLNSNTLLFALMDQLLAMSDVHVDEYFSYRGFHRFSRSAVLTEIGRISVILRQQEHLNSSRNFI
ncbi:hypothetical protein MO867_13255 [Microbulbifer sp. OS29]|uniref:Uncharacterized protein n=1 Tax=Microbulbifer okhotskensis TaxID=2926617 RepID=A0A9X2EN44_9GAMM|nr:hypothetical protein [Microbulbifer okhotskensis]MCO1335299.1 hypothetical protein [Microbulbifer okhotskensis]